MVRQSIREKVIIILALGFLYLKPWQYGLEKPANDFDDDDDEDEDDAFGISSKDDERDSVHSKCPSSFLNS